jgi:glycosyltransferase involved in cell wall biosynthesis
MVECGDKPTHELDSRLTTQDVNPAISLLVPIYNVERYLEQCLESARQQTFVSLEVICINDGSTDGSRTIIESFLKADSRFRVIDKPNSGYGASMNEGLKAARGTYVAILESDDFFELDALERLHRTAQKYNAEVVKANFWLYWSVPQERRELFELVLPSMANRLVNPQEEWDIFYQKPSIWSALYSRHFLEANDIDFLETPGASYQDAGFNFKVWASATRAVFLHDALLSYRQDNETSSVNSPGKVYCVCDEYREMSRYLDQRPEKKTYLEAVKTKMKYDSYMWNYDRLTEELQAQFIVQFAEEFKQDRANGSLDGALFEPWKTDDLNAIIEAPLLFHAQRLADRRQTGSTLRKALYYLRTGGFSLLAHVVRRRLRRRSL